MSCQVLHRNFSFTEGEGISCGMYGSSTAWRGGQSLAHSPVDRGPCDVDGSKKEIDVEGWNGLPNVTE